MKTSLSRWNSIQADIARCEDCLHIRSGLVANPLKIGEIPHPPAAIDLLFVGVAPPALNGKHKGRHFWSNATDPLRIGLFKVLDGLFNFDLSRLNQRSKGAADQAFCHQKLFFIHSCKVRPVPAALRAPPGDVIAACARRHLAEEIVALSPRAVCFLGHNTASAAALLGLVVDDTIVGAKLLSPGGTWTGRAMATVQPIRGSERRTAQAIKRLLAQKLDTHDEGLPMRIDPLRG